MGGDALKQFGIETRRYSKNEYFELWGDIKNKLSLRLYNRRFDIIPAYKNKDSFGDMDILIEKTNNTIDFIQLIYDLFGENTTIFKNSNVLSFNYKDFQIDFILTKSKFYETSLNYFSFNDLNNLTGRIFHKFGLKFGHEGLTYIIKEKTYVFDKILLSQDINKIYKFIDLDSTEFNMGFDSLEDIFKFVSSSKYFHPDIFLLHNRNHESRIRDKKRKTYTKFLKWCENNYDDLNKYTWHSNDERVDNLDKIREQYIPLIFDFFPEKKNEYESTIQRFKESKEIKKKFNGKLVMDITGLYNKELGSFIGKYKASISNFNRFILSSTEKEIEDSIQKFLIDSNG